MYPGGNIIINEKLCKRCGQPFEQYRTTQNLCPDCQYKKVIATPKERRKIIAHKGKVTKQWLAVDRPKWIKNHPPDEYGFWYCYLGISPRCRIRMTQQFLTIDHVKARSRDPAKRRKQQNLKPACLPCNKLKGSRDIKTIKKLYPQSLIARGSIVA